MVAHVAVTALARAGATGARAATGVTVRAVRVGGRAAAAGVRSGARAGGKATAAGARAGGKATAAGARAGGKATAGGSRSGLRSVRPGGVRRPPRGPGGQWGRGRSRGRTSEGAEGPAGEQGGAVSADAMPQVARGAGQALRTIRRVVRPLRRSRRRRRLLRGLTDKAKEQRQRQRRRVRRLAALVGLLFFLMFATSFAAVGGVGERPDTSVPGGSGTVAGIPYADLFNATAELGIDPRLVAAVAWAESGFDPDVVSCERASAAGALGIMQFMPGTARGMGIDPCDPAEAIPAGARYLLTQYERFGSWELALAAYNAGPGAVEQYGGIPPYPETQKYVPKIMTKWDAYKEQFPSGDVDGGGDGGPGDPMGSTERYTERSITPTTQRLLDALIPEFGRGLGVGCYRDGDSGEHPLGRACDLIMSSPLNTMPTEEYLEHGWRMANWLVANADEYDVYYVIWQEKIWSNSRPGAGWQPYTRYPNGNLQQNHYDHVHVSVY